MQVVWSCFGSLQVDYLVGCHEGEGERLFLAAGSSRGSVALFDVELPSKMTGCSVAVSYTHLTLPTILLV